MRLRINSSAFLFWILFNFLCNFVKCTRNDELSTSSSADEDDDLDTYATALIVLVVAIMVSLVFLVVFSIVFIVAGESSFGL